MKFKYTPESTPQQGPWFRRNGRDMTPPQEGAVSPEGQVQPERHWGDPLPKKEKPRRKPMADRRPPRTPLQFRQSFLWQLLAVLMVLVSAAVITRLVQRVLWLTTEFKPLHLEYEKELMITYEGLVVISSLLTLLTTVSVFIFAVRRKPGGGLWLRRVLSLRRIMCHVGAWLWIILMGGAAYLVIHYRMSVSILGILGILAAAGVVLFMFQARFFRSCARVVQSLRVSFNKGYFPEEPVRCGLKLQSLVTAAFMAVPVLVVILEGMLVQAVIEAVSGVIPFVTADTIRTLLGDALTSSATSMYAVDSVRCILQAMAVLITFPLYMVYRRSCRPQKRTISFRSPNRQ